VERGEISELVAQRSRARFSFDGIACITGAGNSRRGQFRLTYRHTDGVCWSENFGEYPKATPPMRIGALKLHPHRFQDLATNFSGSRDRRFASGARRLSTVV